MIDNVWGRRAGMLVICALLAAPVAQGQDGAPFLEFQRAADSYAFTHRQKERRGDAMRVAREGALFTPVVAEAFRTRIASAVRGGCQLPERPSDNFAIPVVNSSSRGAAPLSSCLAASLPKLPDELEYRVSGEVLLLADAHLNVVVDVLHAAFRRRDN